MKSVRRLTDKRLTRFVIARIIKMMTKKKTRPSFYEKSENVPVVHSDEQESDEIQRVQPVVEIVDKQTDMVLEDSSQERQTNKEFWSSELPVSEQFNPGQPGRGKGKLLIGVIAVFLIILAVGAGTFVYLSKTETKNPEPSPTPEVVTTPTPSPEVDRSAYKVAILNGSGITGEAARLKEKLIDLNFEVERTGNADKSNYKKTVIQTKEGVSHAFIEVLEKELAKRYVLSTTETLDKDSKNDVVVIIGKEKTESSE